MLDMPGVLVAHDICIGFVENLHEQRGDVRLVAKLFYRREQRFEIEDDRAGQINSYYSVEVLEDMYTFVRQRRGL